MIKASIGRTPRTIDLIPQSLRRSLVDLHSTRHVVHIQKRMSKANIIDRIAIIVSQNRAIPRRIKLNVDVVLDISGVFVVLRAIVRHFDARKQRRDEVIVCWVATMFHLAVGHPGQVARFAMETIVGDLRAVGDREPAVGEGGVARCEGGAGECQDDERGLHRLG